MATSGATLVLYDGGCGFCRASACFAAERLRTGDDVRFAALQSEDGRAALVAHGFPADYGRSVVVIENGQAFTESAATLRLVRHLRWPWRGLGAGRLIPRPMRNAMYRWVARNRGKLAVNGEACAVVPSPGNPGEG